MATNFQVLSNDQLHRAAPSIFATQPWEKVSDKYAFVPTIQVVDALRAEGFLPVRAQQSRTRIPGKAEFTKHLLRFRHADNLNGAVVGDEVPELVLVNSHDRTSSYQLSAGIFRLVCSNGLVVKSAAFGDINIQHSGDITSRVIEGSYEVVGNLSRITETIDTLKGARLNDQQQIAFAKAALALKAPTDEHGNIQSPIQPERLLEVKRFADAAPTVWNTFNRVQENLLKGGQRGRSATGRRVRTRSVASVTEDLRLNKSLWVLAEELAKAVQH